MRLGRTVSGPAAGRQAKREVYRGVSYDSQAEARRAKELDFLVRTGTIRLWLRQTNIHLGEDFKTEVDFVIHEYGGNLYAEEVKGLETKEFRRVRKLWKKRGPFPLKILKWKRGAWQTETLYPDGWLAELAASSERNE